MITPELIAYIEKQQSLRVPMAQIKKNLAKAGWARADIESAFSQIRMKSISTEKSAPTPTTSTEPDLSTIIGKQPVGTGAVGDAMQSPSTSIHHQALQAKRTRGGKGRKILFIGATIVLLLVVAYFVIQALDIRLPDEFAKKISDETVSLDEVIAPAQALNNEEQQVLDRMEQVVGIELLPEGFVSADIGEGYISLTYDDPYDDMGQLIADIQNHLFDISSWRFAETDRVGASAYELSTPTTHQRLLIQAGPKNISLTLSDLPIIETSDNL